MDNESTQPSKLRTKNWVEINDDTGGTYNSNNQIKFKTTMLKSSLYEYSYVYMLAKGAIKFTREGVYTAARQADEINK